MFSSRKWYEVSQSLVPLFLLEEQTRVQVIRDVFEVDQGEPSIKNVGERDDLESPVSFPQIHSIEED